MKFGSVAIISIFGLVWSAVTLVAVFSIGCGIFSGLHSRSFLEAQGRVIKSTIKVGSTSTKGGTRPTYSAEISYKYTVNGENLNGTRIQYGQMGNSSSDLAQSYVKRFPEGASVPVYYEGSDPSNSVLVRGVEPQTWAVMLFVVPFVLVMLGIWIWGGDALIHLRRNIKTGGVAITERSMRTHVRLSRFSVLGYAFTTLGTASIASTFIILIGFNGDLSQNGIASVWAGLLLLTALAAGSAWNRAKAGAVDLVIDEGAGELLLPWKCGRKGETRVSINDIKGVSIQRELRKGSKGKISWVWIPTFIFQDGNRQEKLSEWQNEEWAQTFTNWLRERLKIAD